MDGTEKQGDTPPPHTHVGNLGPAPFGSAFLDKFPQWFALLLALIYGTGFLTVFTFYNYFGVRSAVVEGLKAKYVHVGILCLQFPLSLALIVLATLSMMPNPKATNAKSQEDAKTDEDKEKARARKRKMAEAWAMSMFCLVMLFFFYLLTTFARPGHFAQYEIAIALFFLTVIAGVFFMAWQRGLFWVGARFKLQLLDPWSVEVRWLLVAILTVQTFYVFAPICKLVWEMLCYGGYMYFLLVFLIIEFLWRLKGRYDSDKGAGFFPPYAIMGLTVCAALFYLSTVTFAYRVYSYIPVAKGGGDYTDEHMSILKFDEKFAKSIPADLKDLTQTNSFQSKPLMIIDETDSLLFIAEPNATNGPAQWRMPGHLNKPKVITIRREAVTAVESQ